MKTLIKLKIERFMEKNEEYYVATSDDLQGLVAEGKTIEEVIEIAEDVARILLDLEKETSNKIVNQELPNIIEYPLLMEV